VDVEAIRGLGRAGRLRIGAAGILPVFGDAAGLIEREDMAVRIAHREERPRQPEQDLADEWAVRESIRRRVTRSE
jgi:hypothetical protein